MPAPPKQRKIAIVGSRSVGMHFMKNYIVDIFALPANILVPCTLYTY